MINIKDFYQQVFSDEKENLARNINKEMNATNAELWHKARIVFYGFAIIGNIASVIGCSYGIFLMLSVSLPAFVSWTLAIMVSVALELTFIIAYQAALIKTLQGEFRYALPYFFAACFYIIVYFPTTEGFQSFVVKTDTTISKLNDNFTKDSTNIAKRYDTRMDSLGKRIVLLESERNSLSYYVDITRNNSQQKLISGMIEKLDKEKTIQLEKLATKKETSIVKAENNLIQSSQRHFNLALIIILYVFVIYSVIIVIKHFADEEYKGINKKINKTDGKPSNGLVNQNVKDMIDAQKKSIIKIRRSQQN